MIVSKNPRQSGKTCRGQVGRQILAGELEGTHWIVGHEMHPYNRSLLGCRIDL